MKQSLLVAAPPSSGFLELCLDPLAFLPRCSAQIGVCAFPKRSAAHPHTSPASGTGFPPGILTFCFLPEEDFSQKTKDFLRLSLPLIPLPSCLRIPADSTWTGIYLIPGEPHKPRMALIHKHWDNWLLKPGFDSVAFWLRHACLGETAFSTISWVIFHSTQKNEVNEEILLSLQHHRHGKCRVETDLFQVNVYHDTNRAF